MIITRVVSEALTSNSSNPSRRQFLTFAAATAGGLTLPGCTTTTTAPPVVCAGTSRTAGRSLLVRPEKPLDALCFRDSHRV
ncbi:twin-arginine translocation signal domain-containing protein [Aurantimonas sp. DM33-3]|nr:twin-arginine translocation signal domain-containing protein [Aurantimonas sp. DM33-3]